MKRKILCMLTSPMWKVYFVFGRDYKRSRCRRTKICLKRNGFLHYSVLFQNSWLRKSTLDGRLSGLGILETSQAISETGPAYQVNEFLCHSTAPHRLDCLNIQNVPMKNTTVSKEIPAEEIKPWRWVCLLFNLAWFRSLLIRLCTLNSWMLLYNVKIY